ncbi:hypothetical protein GCM10025786_25390 [Nocardioides caeni]
MLAQMTGHSDVLTSGTVGELLKSSSVRATATVVSVADGPVVEQDDGDQIYHYRFAVITLEVTDDLGAQTTPEVGSMISVSVRRGTDVLDMHGQPYFERPVPPTSIDELARAIPVGTRAVVLGNLNRDLRSDLRIDRGGSRATWGELVDGSHPQRFSLETGPAEMSGWPDHGYDSLVEEIVR